MQSCKWRNLVWEKHKSVKVSLLYGLFFSLLTSPSLSQVILKPWARQCRRHHHPHRRHHHPYHRHKDLHQLESTSSGFPDWSNALRTLLPSCWRMETIKVLRLLLKVSHLSYLHSEAAIVIQSSSDDWTWRTWRARWTPPSPCCGPRCCLSIHHFLTLSDAEAML